MTYNVLELLPHREPIKLVDEIVSVEKEKFIIATRYLPEGDPLFEGHFPGRSIFPGVLGIEALAQASTCLVLLNEGRTQKNTLVYFMGVENAKFRKMIAPGDMLELYVKQVRKRGSVYKFDGTVSVDGDVATEASFTAKWDIR